MDPSPTLNDIAFDFMPFFRAYKDGRVERNINTDIVPTSSNSDHPLLSKDVTILPGRVSARLFLPTILNNSVNCKKVPLLVYFHGGAFCFGSPFCAMYHNYVSSVVEKGNVVAVSVDYRLAPENLLPAAYEDSWHALKWVFSHSDGHGVESWLNEFADFENVFLAGESAGANITHNMAMRAGIEKIPRMKLSGICVIQPDFVGKTGSLNPAWKFTCPETSGEDDPRINPAIDPKIFNLGCSNVLVCVAEKDAFRDGGWTYYEAIKKSSWRGDVELVESLGENHVFHLFDPSSNKAMVLLERIVTFINS